MWPTETNRQAWDQRYGHPFQPAERLPDAVRDRLPDVSGKHVLHLGCRTGNVSAELIELGALVTGVDPSEEALVAARERAPDAAFFQAELHELPLLLRRSRFNVVYAGEGALSAVSDLDAYAAGIAAALRKGGHALLHDWHPVALCVEPVGLRWRDSYFSESLWRLGQVVAAVSRAGLRIEELAELPPALAELGGRLDPRMPTDFLLVGVKTEASQPGQARAKRAS
jgi:SAM-dependent methyltransferase